MIRNEVKVSVVTVCYNCREDLLKTIHSVASQTYKNIEYIVIDGGSSDGSLEVLKENQENIHHWKSEPDKGIYDAMNKGIDFACGEWIIFMNAGDVFYDNCVLEKIFANNYSDVIGIIYGDVELDFGKNRKVLRSLNKFSRDAVVKELCHQGLLTRTSILKEIKYDTSFRIFADVNSFIRINKMGWEFAYVPIIFATFEITGGISSNRPFLSLEEKKRLDGDKTFSVAYLKKYLHAVNRYIMLKILPKGIYDSIRYRKLAGKSEYQRK